MGPQAVGVPPLIPRSSDHTNASITTMSSSGADLPDPPRNDEQEEAHHQNQPPSSKQRRSASLLELILIPLVCVAFLFGFVRPFVAEPFSIPSESMTPTLVPGESVLVSKSSYRFGSPKRGDLVAFVNPENPQETLIKRVVGVPGDKVAMEDGVLVVNDEAKEEPYVNYSQVDSVYFGPVSVPDGEVFVMGDNRSNSRDSRAFGPVKEEELSGKVVARLWPLDRIGYLGSAGWQEEEAQ